MEVEVTEAAEVTEVEDMKVVQIVKKDAFILMGEFLLTIMDILLLLPVHIFVNEYFRYFE